LESINLKETLSLIPPKPGVYQYFDASGKIIYIGKAKNLKKRVSQYFNKENHDSYKTKILVKKIVEIKYIVVDSEQDALLLENNLIKKHQPRYNILLKDDKTFPWICIKNEPFPRIISVRNYIKDGSVYFGPYASYTMYRTLLDLIRQLFKYRTCKLNLTQENINAKKFNVCLEYHIGNCLAPCVKYESQEQYNLTINNIKQILKGNIHDVKLSLKNMMKEYACNYKFEEAQLVKEKIEILEKYQVKSTIVNPQINNVDVFNILNDKKEAFVNYLKIVDGAIIQTHTVEIRKKLEESNEEILQIVIPEIREKLHSNSPEIILPEPVELEFCDAKITVPKIGDKIKLLELSHRNLMYYRQDKISRSLTEKKEEKTSSILEIIKNDLRLKEIPELIECFDISNIQGTNVVASCVVFRNAKPANKEYRHFNIKTVEGQNDFASMHEVIFRRYKRKIEENEDIPQLVIIDGGKGQLNAAVDALKELGIYGNMAIIGVAKRLEEIFFPGDKYPVYIKKTSHTLRVIQHIRNEAHRFVIGFHRNKRSEKSNKSILNDIHGLGDKTIAKLWKNYKSIEEIKLTDIETLAAIVGKSKTKIIKEFLSGSNLF